MFPFRSRIIPSARLPLEIKTWVLEWLIISYKDISPASWCAMVNVGSFFRSAVKCTFSGTGRGPLPHGSPAGQTYVQLQLWVLEIFLHVLSFTTYVKYQNCYHRVGKKPQIHHHQGMIHTKMGRSTVTSSTIAAWHNNWIAYPCNC